MSKESMIAEQFLEPIGALTRRQDNFDAFAERLARYSDDITPKRLEAAVDYVMARWRQKSFPTFGLLKEALQSASTVSGGKQETGGTEKEWIEAAVRFVEARHGCYAAVPYSLQWWAWFDYHTSLGHLLAVARFNSVAANGRWFKGEWITDKKQAVPCEWPWDFDANYPSRMVEQRDPRSPMISDEERERVRELFAQLKLTIGEKKRPERRTA